jgi:hypothetical protein
MRTTPRSVVDDFAALRKRMGRDTLVSPVEGSSADGAIFAAPGFRGNDADVQDSSGSERGAEDTALVHVPSSLAETVPSFCHRETAPSGPRATVASGLDPSSGRRCLGRGDAAGGCPGAASTAS